MTQPPVAVACFCSMPRTPAAKILAARNTALYWKWYFQVTSSRFERRVQDKMRRDLKRIIPHSIRPYGHSLPSYAAGNTSRRLVACLYWRISQPLSNSGAIGPGVLVSVHSTQLTPGCLCRPQSRLAHSGFWGSRVTEINSHRETERDYDTQGLCNSQVEIVNSCPKR